MTSFQFPSQFFITATDTNVGKSVVSALLTLGLNGTYWKPVQSGLDPISDTDYVRNVTQLDASHFLPERFRLTQPLSPHLAARLDGVEIHLSDFSLPESVPHSPLIVEGAGGLLVPLNSQDLMIDLIKHLGLPVCLVTGTQLGTINHTLLSIRQLQQANIPILGVIMNGPKNLENKKAIAHFGNVSILAELEPLADVNPSTLKASFEQLF
ncbi:MAG: dethiobiotin synthase [Synechococcales cyanobacterium T60_A2020_003]|nr:dethiobiotin synthase [Synechococcales cyanobacterium T60_A2020_003]